MANNRGMMLWSDFPYRKDAAGTPLCRKCGKALGGRKTAWCGKECLRETILLCHWPAIRRLVLRRDKHKCQICGGYGNEVDHIVEVMDGGKSVPGNLRTLCHSCHKKKTTVERTRRAAARMAASLPTASVIVENIPNRPDQENDSEENPCDDHLNPLFASPTSS